MLNINKNSLNNNTLLLSKDYIAGFVHANGIFTAPLIKGKKRLYINPRFILTQDSNKIDHMKLIQKELGGLGNIKKEKSSNIIKYTITNLDVLINNILVVFDKHQVRGNRYYSYLKFKLLVNILSNEVIIYKSKLWLFCILLSTKINPNISLSKQINYLSIEEQKLIIKNELPEGLDINILIKKYCPELKSINILDNTAVVKNTQPLTIEFINGLFDGDGNLSLSLSLVKNKFKLKVGFEIIQDSFNKDILEEIKKYFNNEGKVEIHKHQKNISYLCYSRSTLMKEILPKMLKIKESLYDNNIDWNNMYGPNVKLYKLYNFIIINQLLKNNNLNDLDILEKVMLLIYNIKKNPAGLTFKQFKEKLILKLNK